MAEAKRTIGVLREVSHFTMQLFVEGREEPLGNEERLSSAQKVPLFMLPKEVTDRLALEVLFKSCGGAGWKRKGGWVTDVELCKWEGVGVDAEGRVIMLDLTLTLNNLAGPLPSELQQLPAPQRRAEGQPVLQQADRPGGLRRLHNWPTTWKSTTRTVHVASGTGTGPRCGGVGRG